MKISELCYALQKISETNGDLEILIEGFDNRCYELMSPEAGYVLDESPTGFHLRVDKGEIEPVRPVCILNY